MADAGKRDLRLDGDCPAGEALPASACGADHAARTEWLVRCEPWLRLLARLEIDSRFQGKFSASDVVQETLLEAWRGWEQFRGKAKGQRLAWLREILAHRLAHLARRYAGTQERDVGREQSLAESLAGTSQRLDAVLGVDMTTPSEIAGDREEQVLLAQILENLPPDYREVIILRNMEGLPHDEIARRMQRGVGAVRMLWVRALAQLRREAQRVLGRPEGRE